MKNKTKQSKGKLPKAKRNKPKRLIRIRQSLMLLAALLFLLTLFSGYMAFFNKTAPTREPEAEPTLPVETIQETTAATTEETTSPTETEEAAETTEPLNAEQNDPTTATPTLPVETIQETTAAPTEEATLSTEAEGTDITEKFWQDDTLPSSPSNTNSLKIVSLSEIIVTTSVKDEKTPDSSGFDWNTFPWDIIFFACLALLALDLLAVLLLDRKILSMRKKNPQFEMDPIPHTLVNGVFVTQPLEPVQAAPSLTIGTLHQPGRRQYQQDSLGHGLVLDGRGILAVLADGMGGLQDGDKVSQKIIVRSLELGATLQSNQVGGALYRILNQVNEDVNRMLTPSGLYKCGSTMVAVLVQDMTFQWISVGDSRIYLYREGYVNRLNRDHDLFQDWMPEILNGNRVMEDCLADPDGRKLTSFIGMGRLKYVDGSISAIDILPGDRILLMSDGVYGEVPEEEMAAILKQFPDVNQAAAALDRRVRANQNPHQDNYTALILGF